MINSEENSSIREVLPEDLEDQVEIIYLSTIHYSYVVTLCVIGLIFGLVATVAGTATLISRLGELMENGWRVLESWTPWQYLPIGLLPIGLFMLILALHSADELIESTQTSDDVPPQTDTQ